jgi:hypothetical protein
MLTIISGGQTGVDRAALDAAHELGIPRGGYIPRGRWTETGALPVEYENMVETQSAGPSRRTKLNVRESDATLIITRGQCDGGTLLTVETARKSGRPHLVIDLDEKDQRTAVATAISAWLEAVAPARLNVAGPRASKDPEIYADAKRLLLGVFDDYLSGA